MRRGWWIWPALVAGGVVLDQVAPLGAGTLTEAIAPVVAAALISALGSAAAAKMQSDQQRASANAASAGARGSKSTTDYTPTNEGAAKQRRFSIAEALGPPPTSAGVGTGGRGFSINDPGPGAGRSPSPIGGVRPATPAPRGSEVMEEGGLTAAHRAGTAYGATSESPVDLEAAHQAGQTYSAQPMDENVARDAGGGQQGSNAAEYAQLAAQVGTSIADAMQPRPGPMMGGRGNTSNFRPTTGPMGADIYQEMLRRRAAMRARRGY